MTDNDLVKRLRKRQEFEFIDGYKRIEWEDDDALEAADRIEVLTEQLEAARLDAKEAEAYSVWLEGKLAKAREALKEAWFMLTVPHLDYEPEPEEPGLRRIKTTLAELTGDKP
jgi:hypothetical protein